MTTRLLMAAALCTTFGTAPVAARDLMVVTRSNLLAAQREAYFIPFAQAAGETLRDGTWSGGLPALRSNAEIWDVVLVDAEDLLTGCAEGLLEKLDWPAVGGRDHYQPQAASECGVGAVVHEVVLAWDRDKFPGTPTWSDFWDVAKYPGKRGLQHGARMNLELALMADGVAGGDVYRLLRTDDGVDRAFRKLEQIKPYLVWWKSAAQAPALVGSGEVLLSSAPRDRIAILGQAQASRHFGIQPAGSLYEVASWAIVKGSANEADALKLLASMGDPAREARFAAEVPLGVLAKGATEGLPPEQLATSPSNPAALAVALQVDAQFWHDNAERLDERFDAWLAH